jgi:hypothetical protein
VGRGSRARETLLHYHRPLVKLRDVLSEEVRNAEPYRIFEQDPLRSHQTKVGSVSFSSAVVNAQVSEFFRLPGLVDELQTLLKQTTSHLGKLPKPPPENPVTEIIELVSMFSRSLSTYVDGTPDEFGIHQIIRPLHMKFSNAIKNTAPDFRPYKTLQPMNYEPPTFLDAEKAELGMDDSAIHVDEVMKLALQ